MDDYGGLAADYEWLFPDPVPGLLAASSPGTLSLLEPVLDSLPPGAAVLDCACGTGADALELARRGFAVTATDASAGMAGQARQRAAAGAGVTVIQSAWADLPHRAPGPFAAAICLGNALGHAGSLAAMTASLASIRQVLAPGAVLIADTRNWELLHATRPRIVPARQVRDRHGVRCASLYVWTVPPRFGDPFRAEIVLLFEAPDGTLSHRRHELTLHPFRYADLTAALAAAGFEVRASSFAPDVPYYAVAATAA